MKVWNAQGIISYMTTDLSLASRLAVGVGICSSTWNSPDCRPAVRAPPSGTNWKVMVSTQAVFLPPKPSRPLPPGFWM